MNKVRWLHISDLHILGNDPAWKNYRSYLLQSIKENELKPDFVVITGDYRNIWKKENFVESERFIRDLMGTLNLKLEHDLFIIPGNHDLEPPQKDDVRTNELKKLMPDGVEPWQKSEDKEDWLQKNEQDPSNYIDRLCGIKRNNEEDKNIVNIQCLLSGFELYEEMAKSLIPWYKMEGVAPAAVHYRTWEGHERLQFNFLHINTALIADGGRCHYQALDLLRAQEVLQEIKSNGRPTIILAHNSFYDLHPEIQKHFLPEMEGANVCAWLCGDTHRADMESEIPCSNGRDKIPIFVAGRAAPDNADTYSENGFYYYSWNGQAVKTKYYSWSLSGDEKEKPKAVKSFPVYVSNKSLLEKKYLYIGYLSCNPNIVFKEKYHLGHAYFIHKIDQIQREGSNVAIFTSSYILGNNRTREIIRRDNEYAVNMIHKWGECFDGRVEVVDVSTKIERGIESGVQNQQFIDYVSEMEFRLNGDDRANGIIEKWYQTGEIRSSECGYIKDFFKVDHQHDYTEDEILSFAYLLYKRPVWYNNTWLVNFIRFWNVHMYPYIRDNLGISIKSQDIRIIEATRNSYVWSAISYCAKKFNFTSFPEVVYFENLLDTDCKHPMKSSNRDKVFLLKDYGENKTYSDEFIDHIHKMFGTNKSPAEVAEEYFRRLHLDE